MINNNKNNLKQIAQDYSINPPESAWVSVDAKLKLDKTQTGNTKIFFFKPIFGIIAAAFVATLLAVTIFIHDKEANASAPNYAMVASVQSDAVEFPNDRNIYQTHQLNTLREAYKILSVRY